MRILNTRRRKMITTLAACTAAGLTGLVFAAWLSESTGEAQGQIGTLQPVVVSAGTTNDACLPGGSCAGGLTVQNPNDGPLLAYRVTDASGNFNIGGAGVGGPGGSCHQDNAFAGQGVADVTLAEPVALPANASTPVRVPALFSLRGDAPNACAGLGFAKPVKVFVKTP